MEQDIGKSEIGKELERQVSSLSDRIKLFWRKKDKIEKTLLTVFACSMLIGASFLGLAYSEVLKNRDCQIIPFNLTSINEKPYKSLEEYGYGNIVVLDQDMFIVNGILNNTNVSYDVVQPGMDIFQLREMFPNGEYYLNMCPEINKISGQKQYVMRGLLDVNTINKIFFEAD